MNGKDVTYEDNGELPKMEEKDENAPKEEKIEKAESADGGAAPKQDIED